MTKAEAEKIAAGLVGWDHVQIVRMETWDAEPQYKITATEYGSSYQKTYDPDDGFFK